MLRRLTRQSRLSLRKKVPGHSATLHFATGCAMSFGELYPSVGDAPDSSAPVHYAAWARLPLRADTRDSCVAVGYRRWSLRLLRYVAPAYCLRSELG